MNSATLVQKLWNYCNVLRDDGMSYGDYVEQLTYLLFLKMADERSRPPYNQRSLIPAQYAWPSLPRQGRRRAVQPQDPAKLRRVIVDLIDKETWITISADVKGDAYERAYSRIRR